MYSFLVCANLGQMPASDLLRRSSAITQTLMPNLGVQLEVSYKLIPEIEGGWFYLAPNSKSKPKLISELSDTDTGVIAFGEIYGDDSFNCAEIIKDIYRTQGLDNVRRLNGCFSAVIVDLKENRTYIVSDLIGRRSLRYYTHNRAVLISNHDVPIVATGLFRPEYNLNAVSSIVCTDWSLQGESLLKNIKVPRSNEYIVLSQTGVQHVNKPIVNLHERLNTENPSSVANHLDGMIDKLVAVTRKLCRNEELIHMDLTAGVDSRAVLGLVLAVVEPSRVKAYVRGGDGSLDVTVAERIGTKYQFTCESALPLAPNPDSFLEHATLLAFFMNGDTDSKRAVQPLPKLEHHARLYLKGMGGEVYRGYYYGAKSAKALSELSPADAAAILNRKFSRLGTLPWAAPELLNSVRSKINSAIEVYYDLGARGADLLDCFYVYERLGRWASLDPRGTWFERQYSPFSIPELVMMGFKLPQPIGSGALLHRKIIGRYLPGLYYWPINGKEFLTLLDAKSNIRRYGRFVCRGVDFAIQRIKSLHLSGSQPNSQDENCRELFAGPLQSVIRDILNVQGGFGTKLFGGKNFTRILDEHRDGTVNHVELLGLLITMERWRVLVEEASELSMQRCA